MTLIFDDGHTVLQEWLLHGLKSCDLVQHEHQTFRDAALASGHDDTCHWCHVNRTLDHEACGCKYCRAYLGKTDLDPQGNEIPAEEYERRIFAMGKFGSF